MLKLTLRKEFQGRRLKGTAIELSNSHKTGATQIAASEFLDITYPSADALKALEAVGPSQAQPLVLIGERGQGKSHLLGMLYHAFTDPDATRSWLKTWADRLGNPKLKELPLRDNNMCVISETLHRHNYKFLWDLLFDRHPHGNFIQGKWAGLGDKRPNVPSYDILLELFQHEPTALILDEFQTWYDVLTNSKQYPHRNWAFNFIQLLSEIAKEHPNLLVLVVTVRNGDTDAYQQIHRMGPTLVDFKGLTAKQDRKKLLLHRLFENRMQVAESEIESTIAVHVSEYLRLVQVPPSEHDQVRADFVDCWPYAPNLLQLLEDQVLIATSTQGTRDLILILAALFKRNEDSHVVTAADFRLDDQKSGIAALLDSVSNQHYAKLREKAQRNLSAVLDAVKNPESVVPHLSGIVGSLWVRSLVIGNSAGAKHKTLQADITRGKKIDDNSFDVELSTIVENSFNIYEIDTRLVFRQEENPQAKLISSTRNDKLFTDGSDHVQLAREVRYLISGQEGVPTASRVIVLPLNWTSAPWESVEKKDNPQNWDERLPLLVLPESPEKIGPTLGPWLRNHLQSRRNAVRILLPTANSTNLFKDRDLLILSRAVILAERWKADGPAYRKLRVKYERELRDILAKRFDRYAILDTWNYQEPAKCTFHVEAHKAEGPKIPQAIENHIRDNVFTPEDFEALVFTAADNSESIGKLLREMQEPRPSGERCIPWLGEIPMKERIIRICARGDIAINVQGLENLQVRAGEGEDENTAWKRMRGKLGTGKHLDKTFVSRPQAVPHTEDVSKSVPQPGPADELFDGISGNVEQPTDNREGGGTTNGTSPTPWEGGGGTFDDGSDLTLHAAPATSALNLLGKIETWGIGTETKVQDMSLTVSSLSGAQLSKLLRALPDGMTYKLSLNKEKRKQ